MPPKGKDQPKANKVAIDKVRSLCGTAMALAY
jgi:hypothetical protein